ncbi:MAG: CDP-alcohol phosphatidyltransferase family protein [Bacteroidota bacterium]|nr:CDP-alcohol phosphatidyltransferase family protein [Bacteroidota bacterium]
MKLRHIPNILSAYRLVALPFISFAIYNGFRDWFFPLLFINLGTDILDGFLARRFKWETDFGARLDSIADIGTYIMAFWGMITLEYAFVSSHSFSFIIIIGMYLLPQLLSFARFRKFPSFHLYSNKVTGYVQGFFMLFYYMQWSIETYFIFMFWISCLAYIEEFLIALFIPAMRSNLKGIYWMLKEDGKIV